MFIASVLRKAALRREGSRNAAGWGSIMLIPLVRQFPPCEADQPEQPGAEQHETRRFRNRDHGDGALRRATDRACSGLQAEVNGPERQHRRVNDQRSECTAGGAADAECALTRHLRG